MDSLKFLLYTLARIGLIIACTAFAVLVGVAVCPALVSLLPEGSVRETLMGDSLRSGISYAVILFMLLPVFLDDGKKHAAYEIWSSVNVTITLIFMVMVCFIPSIFRDSFEPNGKANAFYEIAYFPFSWLNENGLDFVVSVLLGLGIIAGILFGAYVISFKRYAKAHPVILGRGRDTEDGTEITEEEDES
ncbi:MAG: hypothetical protein IKO27_09135 [Ruminococcus sp.]|nr:hypothetical protein [Ruminococcus sp.]